MERWSFREKRVGKGGEGWMEATREEDEKKKMTVGGSRRRKGRREDKC